MNKDLQTIDMSNVRWIHPGLGKTQRKILGILKEESKRWEFIPMDELTAKVYHPDLRRVNTWTMEDYPITRSQTETVRKAVKALKKRGLVKKEVWPR